MRIALYSNLFPPLFIGGYEIGAARVAAELRRRGNEVLVLTARQMLLQNGLHFSNHCHRSSAEIVDTGPCILGSLAQMMKTRLSCLLGFIPTVLTARCHYLSVLRQFKPDRILLFNPLGTLAPVAADCCAEGQRLRIPVHAYVSDPWLAEWPRAHPLYRLLTRVCHSFGRWILPQRPNPDLFVSCSAFIRNLSGLAEVHPIIPWGIPLANRPVLNRERFTTTEPLTFLYAGQIVEQKGLDLLLHALTRCRRRHRLVVLGADQTSYAQYCKKLVQKLGLASRVVFAGRQCSQEVASSFASMGQVLVVPSVWEEPFSITLLEGMAAGLAVVASAVGGTPEAIASGVHGLLFRRGDYYDLAANLDRLDQDRCLLAKLGEAGRQRVFDCFRLEQMVDRLLAA